MGLVQTVARKRAQIRTSPPLLAMGFSCVPVFPTTAIDPCVGGVFHPLPVDFGEVSKLCQIEQTRIGTHFECVRKTRRVPPLGFGPGDAKPFPAGTLRVTSASGVDEESPVSLKKLDLAYPLWERLAPAVVIRRRPKRVQGLGIA